MSAGDDDAGLPPSDVVPAAFVVARTRRDKEDAPSFRDRLLAMKGTRVDVSAAGITYRGLLVGADEHDLYLRGELRWLVLPLDTVSRVECVDDAKRPLGALSEASLSLFERASHATDDGAKSPRPNTTGEDPE